MVSRTILLSERKDKPATSSVRESRGLSLLEMMAVVSLILILATISMPIYRSIIVHAHEAVLREDLFTMRAQIDRFTHDNERAPASLEELVAKGYMGSIPTDPFTGSNQTWQVQTETASIALDNSAPAGVTDVHSGSEDVALDGTAYASW